MREKSKRELKNKLLKAKGQYLRVTLEGSKSKMETALESVRHLQDVVNGKKGQIQ